MKNNPKISSLGLDTYYAGVEVVFLSRSEFVCNLTICKKTKGKLEIVAQEQQVEINAAIKILKKASRFYLAITGKPVIHKKLSKYYENPQELTGILLPDAKTSEFTTQCFETNGMFYGSMVRSDIFEQVIGQFTQHKLFPENIFIGPFVLTVLPFIVSNDLQFHTSVYTVATEGKNMDIHATNTATASEICLSNDAVSSFNLLALCLCIQAQGNFIVHTLPAGNLARHVLNEAKQKRRFKRLLTGSAIGLFLVMGINFYFNQRFTSVHNQLDEKLALNQQVLADIEKLEKDIVEKKLLLGKRPAASGPVISLIGDQLAATVPAKIKLRNLEIFPMNGRISKEKPIGFAFNKVLVEGISSESEVLDQWIGRCKTFKWVKDVQIVKYDFDHEKRKGIFKLELLLQ